MTSANTRRHAGNTGYVPDGRALRYSRPGTDLVRRAIWRSWRQRDNGEWTSGGGCATIVVMSIESLRSVRDHLSEFVDRVESQHERIVLTRNGHAAAVLISPEDLAQLEETIDVLSDPGALADIREADEAYARGDVARGVEAVRQLGR